MAKQDLKKMAEKMYATKEIVKRSTARDLDTMPSIGVKKYFQGDKGKSILTAKAAKAKNIVQLKKEELMK